MSHFSVLVIGQNPEEQLAPYHEYECTGVKDQYVQFIPAVESQEDLNTQWDANKEDYPTFDKFMEEYHGYELNDGVWGRWTNPNRKWDWYQLGGRWTGFFLLKEGAKGETGSPGMMTQPAGNGKADSTLKKNIDFEGMKEAAIARKLPIYKKVQEAIKDTAPAIPWEELRDVQYKGDIDKAREVYHSQDRIIAFKKVMDSPFADIDEWDMPEDKFIEETKLDAFATYAVVHNGKWQASGDMGWFGVSSNEDENYLNNFHKLIDSLDQDTLLSVYDCHI